MAERRIFIQGSSYGFCNYYLVKVNEAIAAYKGIVEDLKEVLDVGG